MEAPCVGGKTCRQKPQVMKSKLQCQQGLLPLKAPTIQAITSTGD